MINIVRHFTFNIVTANKTKIQVLFLILACSVTLRMEWRVGEWDGLAGMEWKDNGAFYV